MKLQSLRIKNYRNFEDSGVIPYHDLTIFVGENGTGKTSTIDALALLVDHRSPKPSKDEFIDELSTLEVEGVFQVPPSDEPRAIDKYCIGNCFRLRYSFDLSTNTATYSARSTKYVDERLNTYLNLGASELKDLVKSLGENPRRTKQENYEAIEDFIKAATPATEEAYVDVAWTEFAAYMPILQRYSSADYSRPENIVHKTLSTIYRTHFYDTEPETGEERLKGDFAQLRDTITADLNSNINNQLKDRLAKQLEGVSSVGGEFDIDFARGFLLKEISLNYNNGSSKTIDQLGEGHRKKATLAILEWDAEVSSSIEGRSVIKAYDEPDANLDFPAQRKIFNIISQDVNESDNISTIVCTHSLALIDRASADSINRVSLENDRAVIDYLTSDGDDDIKQFLSGVASVSGLRNSSIFYEKAFLVVEGESEENSLGALYKAYTGRTLPEDGILLVNIMTNGQWNKVLKFLSVNKSTCTVLLLDADTQYAGSDCQVTQQKLIDSGFNGDFLSSNCFFIGVKEFEDTYLDVDLATMANEKFPKASGADWVASEFTALREGDKFSEELSKLISREHRQGRIGKPMIASEMTYLYDREKISQNVVLRDLFDKLQDIIAD